MKTYKKVAIAISIIIAVTIGIVIRIYVSNDHFTSPSQEDFDRLEGYSLVIAKTLDERLIRDESIDVSYEIGEKNLIVSLKTDADYGIKSFYPIDAFKIANNEISAKINYYNVKHEHYYGYSLQIKNEVSAICASYGMLIGFVLCIAFFIYLMIEGGCKIAIIIRNKKN